MPPCVLLSCRMALAGPPIVQPMTGINGGRSGAQVKQEFKEIVLSARQDEFFRKNMYANFGEVGIAVKVRLCWHSTCSMGFDLASSSQVTMINLTLTALLCSQQVLMLDSSQT